MFTFFIKEEGIKNVKTKIASSNRVSEPWHSMLECLEWHPPPTREKSNSFHLETLEMFHLLEREIKKAFQA